MFRPIEDGVLHDVQGLPCWTPPPGWLFNPFGGKKGKDGNPVGEWQDRGVHKRRLRFADCYWERDPRWDDVPKWGKWEKEAEEARSLIEKKKGEDSKEYKDYEHPQLVKHHPELKHIQSYKDLQDFIQECWIHRLSGYWFYNNDKPTYITGIHWYYLSCYWMLNKYPDYFDVGREFFYAWDYCVEDPDCLGLNLVTKRRWGKTYASSCIGVESATRKGSFNVGIQSKTDKDAGILYKKGIVAPFRKLPYFFQPKYNAANGKVPANNLRFETGRMEDDEDELGSTIDYRSGEPSSYDGYQLGYYIHDECGKAEKYDVSERWDIVKYCLLDNNGKVVGKALHTTTVEEIDKGGENYFRIWEHSDQRQRNKLGKTNTGLFKFFIPAHHTRYHDKFGFPNKDKAYKDILAEREVITDPRQKSAKIRKEPLDEQEAFSMDSDSCIFNTLKLEARRSFLKYLPKPLYRIGNFHWKDGIRDSDVYFEESDNGRFLMAWEPPPEMRNKKRLRAGILFPDNTEHGCGGIDPYDYEIISADGVASMSLGSMTLLKKSHPLSESDIDEGPALLYLARPDIPDIFFEDCLMALVYYGFQALHENNKDGISQHFKERGYYEYLYTPYGKPKAGIYNTSRSKGGGVNGNIAELIDQFISNHINTVCFPVLIDQFFKFTPMDTTKFDAAMSFGYARMLAKWTTILTPKHEKTPPDITTFLRRYRKSANRNTIFRK